MSGCSCGRDLAPEDRFCPHCGLAVTSPWTIDTSQPAQSPDDQTLLLNSGNRLSSLQSSSEVHSTFPFRWAVAGFTAIALLMWVLFAWPQPERETAVGGEQSGQDDQPPTASSTTNRPSSTGPSSTGDAPLDGSGGRQAATGDGVRGGGVRGDGADAGDEPAGPVVGEPTGLGVVIGSYDSGGPMELVALDTGRHFQLANLVGRPVGIIGHTLITARFGEIFAADLTTADPEVTSLINLQGGWVDYVEVTDDRIWTISETPDEYRLIAMSVDGEQVDELDLPPITPFYGWPGGSQVAGLVQSEAGGIYRRSGSSFERLSKGRIRATGDRLALIEECDDHMRCESSWHDIDTWALLDLPAPDNSTQTAAMVAGDDRWLLLTDWRTGEAELSEILTGRVVRSGSASAMFGYGQAAPISPDGRWLVESSGIAEVLVDLDSGREWPVDLSLRGDSVVMIVDLAGTAFTEPSPD